MASKKRPASPALRSAPVSGNVGTESSEQATATDNKSRLGELIALISRVAKAKGWTPYVAAKDGKLFKYATLTVSRIGPGTHEQVTGTFEVTCDEKITINYHKTSFYNWGLADLQEAIGNHFRSCLGLRSNPGVVRVRHQLAM
jgi:hypothetical protein